MSRILLVEDDPTLGSTLKERLEKEGYSVTHVTTCAAAEQSLNKDSYSLAIVDVGLPDRSGFSLVTGLQTVPFLFLTAMNSAEFRLKGFELGAEDYIPKPFHLKELLLRVQRVIQRHQIHRSIELQGLTVHLDKRCLRFADGKEVVPTSRDFTVLKILIEERPRVVSREEILAKICDTQDPRPNGRTIDNSIVRLRQMLGELDRLRSVRGIGYQWLEPEDAGEAS